MSLSTGQRLGPYEILAPLGAGGMGEVYRARHVKLGRDVAIKVLPDDLASDPERLQRFEREARSASALSHPNIVTIYDIAEQEGTTFIAMEYVSGRTLRDRLRDGPLTVEEASSLARQTADGLAKAHAAGIVHRDLKPENLMVTADGLLKILDFGLAKPFVRANDGASEVPTLTKATEEGIVVGTAHYMSPEQASGGPLDHRSDQFSFGAVLYELLSGERPFEGTSIAGVISGILRDTPRPLKSLKADTPPELETIVRRCLEKDPADRYPSTSELAEALRRSEERKASPAMRWAAPVALIAVAGLAGAWLWFRGGDRRWTGSDALAEVTRLSEAGDVYAAYRLAIEARERFPDDAGLRRMLERISIPMTVVTQPPDAEVHVASYLEPNAPWEHLGRTPLETRVPYALMRWKIAKEGFETFEGAPFGIGPMTALMTGLPLEPAGTRPEGMVLVPGGVFSSTVGIYPREGLPSVQLGSYWLDRYEVTNREFKAFVDAGGYQNREWWPEGWDKASSSFRDVTGRIGPATWSLGMYAEGTGEHPVGGVSWYEAAAYCASAGKTLPTVYHWFLAAAQDQFADIVRLSNFTGQGPAPVGSHRGLGDYGTYDMAGNVKEWAWNETEGHRYVLGGAWSDPTYMFKNLVAEPPTNRLAQNGIRCARYQNPLEGRLLDPVTPAWDFVKLEPVDDALFEAYVGMYDYDRTPLQAQVESTDESSPYWRMEKVSFDAAYGNERVTALLFLPRDRAPPYQTVIWFPGDDVFISRSSEALASAYLFDFLPRSGRALVYPIYKGMYERFAPISFARNEWRDRMIEWSKDLGRTIDYLETREDIASDKLAYYGFSSGANYGPILTAIDPRFRASIMLASGILPLRLQPEMEVVNFAPRSRVPTLMINGRDDYLVPFAESQRPLFELLGAEPSNKRHARLAGGHIPSDPNEIIREVLDWLDRHLGPV
jgi:predicted esterase